MKNRNFVVARYWDDERNSLCIYAYGTQVQYGDEKHAEHFLNYVKEQKPESADEWQIFWLDTERDDWENPEEIRQKVRDEKARIDKLKVENYKAWVDLKNDM